MSLKLTKFKTFFDTNVTNKLTHFNALLEDQFKNSNINCSTFVKDFQNVIINNQTFIDIQDKGDKLFARLNKDEKIQAISYTNNTNTTFIQMISSIYQKKMHKCELENFKNDPAYLSDIGRTFEFIMRGDINITKIKKRYDSTYKITFCSVTKILTYQVHKNKNNIIPLTHLPEHPNTEDHPVNSNDAFEYIKNNPNKVVNADFNLNKNRNVKLSNIDEFISDFNSVENFKPTAIMEIGYKRYLFVINKVKKNYINNKLVFYISTKEIRLVGNLSNNLSKKIPTGIHKRVRIDIDDYEVYGNSSENATGKLFCPAGSNITTMNGSGFIDQCRWNCNSGYSLTGGVCWQQCTNGTWDVLWDCWAKEEYFIFGWVSVKKYTKSSYIPSSFSWSGSNGYICSASTNNTTKCFRANDMNASCDTTRGATCCPPGASC